jgi:hypothetical protein
LIAHSRLLSTADTVLQHEYTRAPESHFNPNKRYSINLHYHIKEKTEGSTMREEMMKKEYICELYNAGYIDERPQVCDNFQKSKEIENSENLENKFDIRAAEGMVFATIISISIWIFIISFIIWVIS